MNKLLIICGPTASGKTSLSIECAKLLKSEIISADSMNVYARCNIGTAKPNKEEMWNIKHHLIDVVTPEKTFSVGDYREIAMPIINRLISENKVPVICGGTGFYINSLIYNLSYGNSSANLEARNKYYDLYNKYGSNYVYDILKEKDIDSASKIHQNDIKRVIRALEIFESGTKKSNICDDLTPIFPYSAYMIDIPRQILYDRIDARVDIMIKNGLVEEVKDLMNSGITLDNQCMQGIGYKEIYEYLTGGVTLENAIDKIKLNTHHYAKRQITFFKKLPNLQYLPFEDSKILAKRIVDNL